MDARELLSVNPREWHAGQLPGTEQAARQSRRATDKVRGKSLEPDQLLMAALRRGDQNAVREVVQRLNPRLFRVARGIVASDAEAEDVVQKTYLLAFTHLHQFREDALFSTWITRIAINTARMQMRSERFHDSYDTVADEPPLELPSGSPTPSSRPTSMQDASRRACFCTKQSAVFPNSFASCFCCVKSKTWIFRRSHGI